MQQSHYTKTFANVETYFLYENVSKMMPQNLEKAIANFKKALAIEPRLIKTHLGLATAFDEKGDKDNAIKHYNFFIQYAPAGKYDFLIVKAKERLKALAK